MGTSFKVGEMGCQPLIYVTLALLPSASHLTSWNLILSSAVSAQQHLTQSFVMRVKIIQLNNISLLGLRCHWSINLELFYIFSQIIPINCSFSTTISPKYKLLKDLSAPLITFLQFWLRLSHLVLTFLPVPQKEDALLPGWKCWGWEGKGVVSRDSTHI